MGRATVSYAKTTRCYKNSTLVSNIKHGSLTASETFICRKMPKLTLWATAGKTKGKTPRSIYLFIRRSKCLLLETYVWFTRDTQVPTDTHQSPASPSLFEACNFRCSTSRAVETGDPPWTGPPREWAGCSVVTAGLRWGQVGIQWFQLLQTLLATGEGSWWLLSLHPWEEGAFRGGQGVLGSRGHPG